MPETPKDESIGMIPAFRPVPASLYPTLDNLESVVMLGISQLPITNTNQLRVLLMTYHNTLLKVLKDEQSHV